MESSSPTHVHNANTFQRNYTLKIDPPVLNSASPWATTKEDLERLYHCPYTGAVTIRTSTLEGAGHDDLIPQYSLFTPGGYADGPEPASSSDINKSGDQNNTFHAAEQQHSSLHTTSHSPLTLSEYLGIINEISGQRHLGTADDSGNAKKPWILSVAGDADEVGMAYALVANAAEMDEGLRLCVEVNLACSPATPSSDGANISDKEEASMPPAYEEKSLREFLESVADAKKTYWGRMAEDNMPRVGIKLPPFLYREQFEMVGRCLRNVKGEGERSAVDFVVTTDSLPGCLGLRREDMEDGLGRTDSKTNGNPSLNIPPPHPQFQYQSLSGSALHPLALGNVHSLRRVLDRHPETKDILIIGCGGVEDRDGFDRMRRVGAGAVGVGTGLGREGVGVFGRILGQEGGGV